MIVLVVFILIAVAAVFCLKGGGDCYGSFNSPIKNEKKDNTIDNDYFF